MKFVEAKVVRVTDFASGGAWVFIEGKEYAVHKWHEYVVDEKGQKCYLMQKGSRVYAPGLENKVAFEVVR